MMLRKKSSPWMRTKALYIIPVAVIALSAFATPELNNKVDNLVEPTQTSVGKVTQKSVNDKIIPVEIADTTKQKADDKVEVAVAEPNEDANETYDTVEEMPQYPGGMVAMMQFVAMNIKYPKVAEDAQVEGRAIVAFIVEKDGSVSNVEIMKFSKKEVKAASEANTASTGDIKVVGYEKEATATDVEAAEKALKDEAVRVVKSMPNWTPGKQKGEAVRVKFVMPINFSLK